MPEIQNGDDGSGAVLRPVAEASAPAARDAVLTEVAMDLKEYDKAKFELSSILRSAALVARRDRPNEHNPYADMFSRLAQDRFNVAVVGRYSRGKTSLMNAMLDTDRLPTGIVPLTSVITTVGYGSAERAFIDFEGSRIPDEIPLASLPKYVTQQSNPGNTRRVAIARVQLPCELLRRGFYLVDTPGLGSSIRENTRTTETYLPEADAFMLVTSYDSPLSEEELRVLQAVASSPDRVFLVVNKQDVASEAERAEVLRHVREQARRVYGETLPQIFSVSARDGLEANRLQDHDRFKASGIEDLKETLVRFLLNEKQIQFLLRMSERIAALPNAPAEGNRLAALYAQLAQRPLNPVALAPGPIGIAPEVTVSSCPVCARIEKGMYDFLCQYQYEVCTRRETQAELARGGGLCEFHTWQYEGIASPRGTCIGFSGVLEQLAVRLRSLAEAPPSASIKEEIDRSRPTRETCPLCRVHRDIERSAIADAARGLTTALREPFHPLPGVCLPHMRIIARSLEDRTAVRRLLLLEAGMLERVAEDMHRFALKHDGVRRFLASDEEMRADRNALVLLAGHPNVNAV
jgi:GTP-binding protein EngB required for normal cell division